MSERYDVTPTEESQAVEHTKHGDLGEHTEVAAKPEHRAEDARPEPITRVEHRDPEEMPTTRESRRTVFRREREEHGGIQFGATFFGWLTATGMAVLLTTLVAATGTALGIATETSLGEAAGAALDRVETIGLVGAIVLLAIVFISYFSGGYVAGRMARFDGFKQGLGVWLWSIVIALVIAGLVAVAGDEYNVLRELNTFPRVPLDEGTLTDNGILALGLAILASLGGALLGGSAGMHFHRAVDRTGLGR